MRRIGRRTAIGATALALVLAATGTSLATVRAARDDNGLLSDSAVVQAGEDLGPGIVIEPATESARAAAAAVATTGPLPGLPDAFGVAAAEPTATTATTVEGGPAAAGIDPPPEGLLTAIAPSSSTVVPVGGPTPTTNPSTDVAPVVAAPVVGCPSDSAGRGALPQEIGRLQAVDFVLPWPGVTPLVLLPQLSAPRPAGGSDVLVDTVTTGVLGHNGLSLTLAAPLTTVYRLVSDGESDQGTITFTKVDRTTNLTAQACRDRSLVLYDIGRAAVNGSPLRIVGVVAPTGTVTIDGFGGIARFRSASAGTHQVTLVTATDAGTAGPILTATITVGP